MRFRISFMCFSAGFLLVLNCFSPAFAAGVGINATRIIIHQGSPAASVTLRNSTENSTYLVQSYLSAGKEPGQTGSLPFDVLPPVFQLAPGSQGDVRLAENPGMVTRLPADRESVFWFHARAIPGNDFKPAKTGEDNHGTVKIALENVIKVFYRPENLPSSSEQAQAGLEFRFVPGGIRVLNASPYYVTMTGISAGNQPVKLSGQDAMLAPFSEHTYETQIKTGRLSWTTINDLGGYRTHHSGQ